MNSTTQPFISQGNNNILENSDHAISTQQASIQQYGHNTQAAQPQLLSQQTPHINKFFYQPSNDFLNYHIECEKMSEDYITRLLNQPFTIMQLKENNYRCTFFYRQHCNNQFYQISCEIVSPSLINDCLNKSFYHAKIEQNMKQDQLAFTSSYQKDNLEDNLTTYLSHNIFC
jgi:hypothetical protein